MKVRVVVALRLCLVVRNAYEQAFAYLRSDVICELRLVCGDGIPDKND